MDDYIQITLLNDFIFCPRSIYFHRLYERYSGETYKDVPQKTGTMKHENIDEKRYSTKKDIMQGTSVFCEQYNVGGKIDLFDKEKGELIERKNKITTIYDGYRYQIYAQYFCLKEMGYEVKKLFFHSLSDNKRYPLPIPGEAEIKEFEDLLGKIRNFRLDQNDFQPNPQKCARCIYAELCDLHP